MSEAAAAGLAVVWRAMTTGDVADVMAVADIVHPTFPEGAHVYHDRLALFPEGCLVAALPDGRIVGYALAYPAPLGAPPPLDTMLGALLPEADALYIHDVAILPDWRGQRLADAAVAHVLSLADGAVMPVMLVSVYGTAPYWGRFGFAPPSLALEPAKLATYGQGAVYMIRPPLAPSPAA